MFNSRRQPLKGYSLALSFLRLEEEFWCSAGFCGLEAECRHSTGFYDSKRCINIGFYCSKRSIATPRFSTRSIGVLVFCRFFLAEASLFITWTLTLFSNIDFLIAAKWWLWLLLAFFEAIIISRPHLLSRLL